MGKIASDATLLRTAKSELSKLRTEFAAVRAERDQYRLHAERATAEAAKWEERFDILLRRDTEQT